MDDTGQVSDLSRPVSPACLHNEGLVFCNAVFEFRNSTQLPMAMVHNGEMATRGQATSSAQKFVDQTNK